jgi:mannose-6-phosphate isomerase-like protein (cupin superfamily)
VHADSRLVTVLVAPKDKTTDLKALVARVKESDEALTVFHRKVYRPWGKFDSIDQGDRFQVKRIMVLPGAKLSLQLHHHRAEHWVVVHGEAEVTCGVKTFRLHEDESTTCRSKRRTGCSTQVQSHSRSSRCSRGTTSVRTISCSWRIATEG